MMQRAEPVFSSFSRAERRGVDRPSARFGLERRLNSRVMVASAFVGFAYFSMTVMVLLRRANEEKATVTMYTVRLYNVPASSVVKRLR